MKSNKKMEVEWLNPLALKEYPNNANIHPEAQIEEIAKSIREFGFSKPVLIDADNVLIAGHGTRLGAIRVGKKLIPCIRHTDWSPRQIAAYRLADNQLAKQSRYDFEKLSAEVDLLVGMDFDITALGFNEQELDALLRVDAGILPGGELPPPVAIKEREKPAPAEVTARIIRDITCPACKHKFQG